MRAARATAGQSRSSRYRLIVLLAAAGVAGCAGAGTTTSLPLITLGSEEGARWIDPRELPRYRCVEVALICTSGDGRLATRLCRCVPQVSAGGSATSSPHQE